MQLVSHPKSKAGRTFLKRISRVFGVPASYYTLDQLIGGWSLLDLLEEELFGIDRASLYQ